MVGLGYAGIAATRMAVEEGASVVVLEKGGSIGLTSSAMAAIGSEMWAKLWPMDARFNDLKGFLVAQTSAMCLNRNNYEVISSWVNENGPAVDWWFGAVPEDQVSWGTQENHNTVDADAAYVVRSDCYPYSEHYDPTQEHFPCIPCSLTTGPKGAWMRANLEKAREEGGDRLKIYNYTAAVRLIHEEGKVTGVVAKDQTGNYIRVNTSKGVVLATVGFMNNERMLRRFLPAVYESGYGPEVNWYSVVDSEGNKCNTGDGHKMGIWAGGKMQTYGATISHLISVSGTIGTMPLLWLDKNGKRFLNEDTQGQQFAEVVRQRPDRVAYQFLDAAYDDYHMDMPVGHGKTPAKTVADVEAKVDGEKIFKADTIEALLAQLDIDAGAAKAAIDRYNELCDHGEDTDFGKASKYMVGLKKAPFYAIKHGRGDDLVTVSGLESDGQCHVLGENLAPVSGLYVADNVQGGRFAEIYPETIRGMSVAMAMTMGRVAGRNAANGI